MFVPEYTCKVVLQRTALESLSPRPTPQKLQLGKVRTSSSPSPLDTTKTSPDLTQVEVDPSQESPDLIEPVQIDIDVSSNYDDDYNPTEEDLHDDLPLEIRNTSRNFGSDETKEGILSVTTTSVLLLSVFAPIPAEVFKSFVFIAESPPSVVPQPRKALFFSVQVGPNLFEYKGHKYTLDPSTGKHSCADCKAKYKRRRDMYSHIKKVHINPPAAGLLSQPRKPIFRSVEVEPNVFEYQGLNFTFDPSTGKHSCAYCKAKVKERRGMHHHMNRFHINPAGYKPIVRKSLSNAQPFCFCTLTYGPDSEDMCEKWQFGRDLLNFVFILTEQEVMCEICGKTYHHPQQLQVHVEGAHGDAKFECTECGKSFKYYASLFTHRRSQHPAVGPDGQSAEPSICSHCGKSFPTSWKLRRHETEMHQTGVFNCRKCEMSFESIRERTRHRKRVHSVKKDAAGKNFET